MTAAAVDAAARAAVVEALCDALTAHYVLPEAGAAMAAAVRAHAAAGDYDAHGDGEALAAALTADLLAVGGDQHLEVRHQAEPQGGGEDAEPTPEQLRASGERTNFGVEQARRLPGNVGYLELTSCFPVEVPGAGEAATSAMRLLAHTRALIVDIRRNDGGNPSMVALVCSYLFDEPVHLNSIWWRAREAEDQSWTSPYVPGRRYGQKPVFVLTSSATFSGAEELAYDLQARGRATIVGERTRGGAHPGGPRRIHPHFEAWIPTGRAVNPVTGGNWEGSGVLPDVAVPAGEALATAYRAALTEGLAAGADPTDAQEMRTALAELDGAAPRHP